MDENLISELADWVKPFFPDKCLIEKASSDASFRSYYRVSSSDKTKIIMVAPLEQEPIDTFLDVTQRLFKADINIPKIYKVDQARGLILMSDLGSSKYLDKLTNETLYCLYTDAIDCIYKMQKETDTKGLREFDKLEQMTEMKLFDKWFLNEHLNIDTSNGLNENLYKSYEDISSIIIKIPKTFVHRDFHSRNLMVTDNSNPGVLDYQDAVIGPITYDIVSLLKDCYITWDAEIINSMLSSFFTKIERHHDVVYEEFQYWFDITGLQRHLKAIGIFARLNYRDNKSNYLNDIPRTLAYIKDILSKYSELNDMKKVFMEINRFKDI
tara:strand:+ start:908 stop:1882 length:975 start_codon:yes stop_codon:yes gene_type:complete